MLLTCFSYVWEVLVLNNFLRLNVTAFRIKSIYSIINLINKITKGRLKCIRLIRKFLLTVFVSTRLYCSSL